MNESPAKRKTALILMIATIATGAAVYSAAPLFKWFVSPSAAAIDHDFARDCATINSQLPKMVDEKTRMVSMTYANRMVTYRQVLIGNDPVPDVQTFIEKAKSNLGKNYQNALEMAPMRQAGVKLEYIYYNEKGKELARVEILPNPLP